MKVAAVLPRGMIFSAQGATSIDLVTRDLLRAGGYGKAGFAIGQHVADPFDDVDFRSISAPEGKPFLAHAAELICSEQPDAVVVHQHLESAAYLAKAIFPIPVILHRHGLLRHKRGFFSKWRKGNHLAGLAGIIFVSDFIRQRFLETYPEYADRSDVVWNGIDTNFWKPADQKEKTITFVGRARADKGIGELIDAFNALNAPDWSLALGFGVQTDAERTYADEIAARINGNKAIHLQCNMTSSEVRDLLAKSSIAALPSIVEEGFPRAVVEAMACGCTLLATRNGGTPEAAGKAGLLIPAGSGASLVQSLLEEFKRLSKNVDQTGEFGRKARDEVLENCSLGATAERYQDVITRMLAS